MEPKMLKFLLVVVCSIALFAAGVECSLSLKGLFSSRTTTTTTTEQPTTRRAPLFINNNIPVVEAHCKLNFECKKKLKGAPAPKPCIKYCLKTIDCGDAVKIKGKSDQCFELDEQLVQQELAQPGGTVPHMQVAMIDFPCQPGYLPDSRGRCREVW